MTEDQAALAASELTGRLLAFEESWEGRPHQAAKEDAIRAEFGVSGARYWQLLFARIETPEALRMNPQLVHRILAQRDRRRAERATRFLGGSREPDGGGAGIDGTGEAFV